MSLPAAAPGLGWLAIIRGKSFTEQTSFHNHHVHATLPLLSHPDIRIGNQHQNRHDHDFQEPCEGIREGNAYAHTGQRLSSSSPHWSRDTDDDDDYRCDNLFTTTASPISALTSLTVSQRCLPISKKERHEYRLCHPFPLSLRPADDLCYNVIDVCTVVFLCACLTRRRSPRPCHHPLHDPICTYTHVT